ncbi:MAG: hypothetical protein ISEC1_P0387 [Thiomicrorhabdus sp.]|nr:MAG: hypothetical protein ISEC1_P0387 [Thiomicrorhabdus sp.]
MQNPQYNAQQGIFPNFWSYCVSSLKKVAHKRFYAVIFLLLLPFFVFADSLKVDSDRQSIEMGEIITLYITADFQTRGSQLNLDSLKDQFEILGKQQSNRIEVINGSIKSNTSWQITLLAKQVGELIVPPLKIGDIKSMPYKISVSPAQKKEASKSSAYFIESSIDKETVYIQEQVLYRLKLNFLGNFNGSVRPPIFENTLSETLKDQVVYGKYINGQQYTVYEWLYAIYPQQSGQLTITGPLFSGIHLYQGRRKGIQEMAETHQLTVLPEPERFKQQSNNTWLPAQSIKLAEQWQSLPNIIHVGDSLSRTLILDSVGLKASQLPRLVTKNQTGFKVYADKPETEEAIIQDGLRSQLQIKQAIIPTRSGQLTLPEQKLTWWNTQTNSIETTMISARTLTILPAIEHPNSNKSNSTNDVGNGMATQALHQNNSENVPRETNTIWLLITIGLGLAWFITLWLWRRQNQQLKTRLLALEGTLQRDKMTEQQTKQGGLATDNQGNVITEIDTVPSTESVKTLQNTAGLCTDNANLSTNLSAKDFYHSLRLELTDKYSINRFTEIEYQPLKTAIKQLEEHLFSQTQLESNALKNICDELQNFEIIQEKVQNKDKASESKLASLYHQ